MLVADELQEINKIPFNVKREEGAFENITVMLRVRNESFL